jgi:hypothetical protein
MFGVFKKKTEKEKLQAKYEKALSEAHRLSQVNRAAGDDKYAEADNILRKIEALDTTA